MRKDSFAAFEEEGKIYKRRDSFALNQNNQSATEFLEIAKSFEKHTMSDDYRSKHAYKHGGFALEDYAVINKYRTAFKTLIANVGKQLLSGKFNLTQVSFPISCMAPISIL